MNNLPLGQYKATIRDLQGGNGDETHDVMIRVCEDSIEIRLIEIGVQPDKNSPTVSAEVWDREFRAMVWTKAVIDSETEPHVVRMCAVSPQ